MFSNQTGTAAINDILIHRIVEFDAPFMPALKMFPALTSETLNENRHWLTPDALDGADFVRLSMQCYVVRTPHHVILIDSCIGNDKERTRPEWHMRKGQEFMLSLKQHGLTVEDVDFVMCTHLHVDHVGWNTRLENGRWVPTFPNARYIFGREEYENAKAAEAVKPNPTFADSVLPIIAAGRADLVEADFGLGDHMRILPTPGHTLGHFSFEVGRARADAVFTGDLCHSPLQMRYPELSFVWDADLDLAARTRRSFFERFCDTSTLCCTSHFVNSPAGLVRPWGDGFRLDCKQG